MRANPDINYRYFVQATESPEPEYELLNFVPDQITSMIELGKQNAQTVVSKGPGVSFWQFEK